MGNYKCDKQFFRIWQACSFLISLPRASLPALGLREERLGRCFIHLTSQKHGWLPGVVYFWRMSGKYKFYNPDGMYFVSFAVVRWVDVFTRNIYREVIIDSLKYCQREKGLLLHAYVIMTNHLHLIYFDRRRESFRKYHAWFKKAL